MGCGGSALRVQLKREIVGPSVDYPFRWLLEKQKPIPSIIRRFWLFIRMQTSLIGKENLNRFPNAVRH